MQNNVAFLVALMTIIWALNTVIIAIVYSLLPLRWALAVILLVSVTCAYFADNFGVVIDVEMIRNSLQTNAAEASDLLTLNLVMRLLLLGVVPIV
ncbi:MAG: DUF1705 domain-containing protein, partial [Paraglaciecola sp.]|nr:DUF1705 domain-containing protein [Paraglaciecola sp.]